MMTLKSASRLFLIAFTALTVMCASDCAMAQDKSIKFPKPVTKENKTNKRKSTTIQEIKNQDYGGLANEAYSNKNYGSAVKYGKLGADNNDPVSMFVLGECYRWGNGVSKDNDKAVYWYAKSAEQGEVKAQYQLALCYSFGWGVAEDKEKAVYWYIKSAEQDYAPAQHRLGSCYRYGEGVTKDLEKAKYWYTKAAEQGDEEAKEKLEQLK